jgi:hypothetical protein
VQCGRRKNSFWQDPVGQLLSYLTEPRPWANKIVATAHNAKAFDIHFIFNRAIMLKIETCTYYEWTENYVHEDEAPGVF